MKRAQRRVIGWREWVGLPELGIAAIKAKIDTGARTSVIHAWNIVLDERRGGSWVAFDLHPIQRNNKEIVSCRALLLGVREIRNSGGHVERRYVIRTKLQLGSKIWPIDLSLTNRDAMGFRMLLGRAAIRRRAMVDPGRSFLVSKNDVQPSARRRIKGRD